MEIKRIKVDKNVTPIHYRKRTPIDAKVGEKYFHHIGRNYVKPCIVTEIYWEGDRKRIVVGIPARLKLKNPVDVNDFNNYHLDEFCLHCDEIGRTPEEAVRHAIA